MLVGSYAGIFPRYFLRASIVRFRPQIYSSKSIHVSNCKTKKFSEQQKRQYSTTTTTTKKKDKSQVKISKS